MGEQGFNAMLSEKSDLRIYAKFVSCFPIQKFISIFRQVFNCVCIFFQAFVSRIGSITRLFAGIRYTFIV